MNTFLRLSLFARSFVCLGFAVMLVGSPANAQDTSDVKFAVEIPDAEELYLPHSETGQTITIIFTLEEDGEAVKDETLTITHNTYVDFLTPKPHVTDDRGEVS